MMEDILLQSLILPLPKAYYRQYIIDYYLQCMSDFNVTEYLCYWCWGFALSGVCVLIQPGIYHSY